MKQIRIPGQHPKAKADVEAEACQCVHVFLFIFLMQKRASSLCNLQKLCSNFNRYNISLKREDFLNSASMELLETCRPKVYIFLKKKYWSNNVQNCIGSKMCTIFRFEPADCQTHEDLWANSLSTLTSLVIYLLPEAHELTAWLTWRNGRLTMQGCCNGIGYQAMAWAPNWKRPRKR